MRRFLILIVLLSGCASRTVAPNIVRQPPQECLQLCQPVSKLASDEPNVVFQHHVQTIIDAGECRRMHESCVSWVKPKESAK